MASGQRTVMLVEDDAETRTVLGEILEMEGFAVVAFANGAEALEYLAHCPLPGLIILDMRMPLMDGTQFRAEMRRDSRLAQIPVVVVTAYEPSDAAKLHVARVFRKPVDINALVDTVRQYC
jgi:CheY-like chemotaxis protein